MVEHMFNKLEPEFNPCTKKGRDEKGRKKKEKFSRLNHIKLSLMLYVVHRATPKTNES